MTEATYDDDLISQADCESLWQEVLLQAVNDAIRGVKLSGETASSRVRLNQQARDYITIPNRDFNEVCSLAGMNPEAVRERVKPMIEAALSPEELAGPETPSRAIHAKGAAHNSRMITFNGRTMNLTGWSKELGMSLTALQLRLNKGWPIERALTVPVISRRPREERR